MVRVLILIAFFLSSTVAYAAQKVLVGVENTNYYPLYGAFDANDKEVGEYMGLAADIFALYNKSQTEFELSYKPLPIKRLVADFLAKDSVLDAKFPDNPQWASDMKKGIKVEYSEPVIAYTDGAFVMKNKDMTLAKIKSLGILAGFSPYDYAPQIASGQIKVEDSINTSSLLEKLIQGKVDTVYISEFIGNCKLKKRPDSGAFYDSALPHSSSHYFLSTIKYPKLLVSFNKFLKDKKSDIDAMTKDYIDNKCK